MSKSIDEYMDINESFTLKNVRFQIIVIYIEKAINRLCDARIRAFNPVDMGFNYEKTRTEQIKEMAVQRWILRYENELKK